MNPRVMKSRDISTYDVTSVEKILRDYFLGQAERAATLSPRYEELWHSINNYMVNGGKRLRPRMVMMAYHATSQQSAENIAAVAAAWELLHISLLIHDDIMDHDYMRHGKLNIAGIYKKRYATALPASEAEDNATSVALLAGDLTLSGAYQLLIETSSLSDADKVVAMSEIAKAAAIVAGGQMLDVESSKLSYPDVDTKTINKAKTASYTFIGPLQTGAKLGGADSNDLEALYTFGESVGIGYQLADDILGVFGDEALTGKSSSSDLREGKRTMLIQEALKSLPKTDHDRLLHILDGRSNNLTLAKDLIVASGARKKIESEIIAHLHTAITAAQALSWSTADKDALIRLAESALQRQA